MGLLVNPNIQRLNIHHYAKFTINNYSKKNKWLINDDIQLITKILDNLFFKNVDIWSDVKFWINYKIIFNNNNIFIKLFYKNLNNNSKKNMVFKGNLKKNRFNLFKFIQKPYFLKNYYKKFLLKNKLMVRYLKYKQNQIKNKYWLKKKKKLLDLKKNHITSLKKRNITYYKKKNHNNKFKFKSFNKKKKILKKTNPQLIKKINKINKNNNFLENYFKKINLLVLNLLFKKLIANKLINVKNIFINFSNWIKNSIDSKFLANYIKTKLNQGLNIWKTMNPVIKDLNRKYKKKIILGYKIIFSGRFSRRQMASYEWFKKGRVTSNTYNQNLDYSFAKSITKYGMCGIKVYLSWNHKRNRNYNFIQELEKFKIYQLNSKYIKLNFSNFSNFFYYRKFGILRKLIFKGFFKYIFLFWLKKLNLNLKTFRKLYNLKIKLYNKHQLLIFLKLKKLKLNY